MRGLKTFQQHRCEGCRHYISTYDVSSLVDDGPICRQISSHLIIDIDIGHVMMVKLLIVTTTTTTTISITISVTMIVVVVVVVAAISCSYGRRHEE